MNSDINQDLQPPLQHLQQHLQHPQHLQSLLQHLRHNAHNNSNFLSTQLKQHSKKTQKSIISYHPCKVYSLYSMTPLLPTPLPAGMALVKDRC